MNYQKKQDQKWKYWMRDNKSRMIGWVVGLVFLIAVGALLWSIHLNDLENAENAVVGQTESPIKAVRNRDYGEPGFRPIAENEYLSLQADLTNGEVSVTDKRTGKTWYTNPQNRTEKGIKGVKNRLAGQMLVTFYDTVYEKTAQADSVSQAINQGGLDHVLFEDGIEFLYSFPKYGVIIPLRYTLVGETLEVSIPAEDFQELWSEQYAVQTIDVLPFFGAGTMADEGYMFIPDGSGALMDFNSDKYTQGRYTASVYASDDGLGSLDEISLRNYITMPVFGVKCNDNAFLAVITQGEASASITSYIAQQLTSYNQVYSTVTVHAYNDKNAGIVGLKAGVSFGQSQEKTRANEGTDNLLRGCDYTIKFYFLDSTEADYSGMSRVYREHLLSVNGLNTSDLTNKQYLVLDVYGAVSLTEYVMGVKQNVITPLTTYNEVCDLVTELKARGVENIIINYIGGLKGGLGRKMMDEVKHEPALGSKAEFQAMLDYMEQQGVIFFLEADPIHITEDGNGYTKMSDGIRTFFDGKVPLLIHRETAKFMEHFTASALRQDVRNIFVHGYGDTLYTNLAKDENNTTRTEAIDIYSASMEKIKQQVDRLMVSRGNIYTAAYADVIIDAATDFSAYDMEEQAVPFYQMVLRGDIALASRAINESADYTYEYLKAMETGSHIKFSLMAAQPQVLVRRDEYNHMVSYTADNWLDTIAEEYLSMQRVLGPVAGEAIVFHETLASGVTRTVYQSGRSVLVNYTEASFIYEGYTINGRSAMLLEE